MKSTLQDTRDDATSSFREREHHAAITVHARPTRRAQYLETQNRVRMPCGRLIAFITSSLYPINTKIGFALTRAGHSCRRVCAQRFASPNDPLSPASRPSVLCYSLVVAAGKACAYTTPPRFAMCDQPGCEFVLEHAIPSTLSPRSSKRVRAKRTVVNASQFEVPP